MSASTVVGPEVHYYARDYDTATGSWVQPDEWRGLLVRPQSLNRYAYIENTPVSFSDDLGYIIKMTRMNAVGKSFGKSNATVQRATTKRQANAYVSGLNAKAKGTNFSEALDGTKHWWSCWSRAAARRRAARIGSGYSSFPVRTILVGRSCWPIRSGGLRPRRDLRQRAIHGCLPLHRNS